VTSAIVITGAPGSGKSSVAQAFTTLLDNAGIAHGAIESEQLAWGTPWLPDAQVHAQLERVLADAETVPALPGVDVVLCTDGRDEESVAADLLAAARAAAIL